jgi:hypothetical protein
MNIKKIALLSAGYIFVFAVFAWVSGMHINNPLEWLYIAFISALYLGAFQIISKFAYPKIFSLIPLPRGVAFTIFFILIVVTATLTSQLLQILHVPEIISNSLSFLIIVTFGASLGPKNTAEQDAAANP